MDLVRKIKINNIHSIEFSKEETFIIKTLEDYIISLGVYKTPQYYNDKAPHYAEYTFYTHSNNNMFILHNNKTNILTISKFRLYDIIGIIDYLHEASVESLILFFIKKHLLKRNITTYILAVNYIDDIIRIERSGRGGITYKL